MKHLSSQALLANNSPEAIIEALEPYVTEKRKARIDAVIEGRLSSLHLAIECPSDINNALAAIRTAESLGIEHIHLINPEGSASAARSITQGAFYWVNIHYYPDLDSLLDYLKKNQIALAGGAVTATQALSDVPCDEALCIIIGNERRGLSDHAISACQHPYKIPMVGMSESFNLSVSAAISLYDISQRKRQKLGQSGDLSQTEQTQARAKYFLNSINDRLANALLKP